MLANISGTFKCHQMICISNLVQIHCIHTKATTTATANQPLKLRSPVIFVTLLLKIVQSIYNNNTLATTSSKN